MSRFQGVGRMKRIAFLSFDWNYEVMAAYYEGMAAYLEHVDDVQVEIFNAYGQHASFEPEEGSVDVFALCDVQEYDGFIVQGNRSWPPEQRQRFVDRVVELGKPVVSVNYDLDRAYCVGTDNYEAEFGLISKVLADWDCVRPAFVNGLISSWEAKDRSQAFWEACSERSIASPRFYQASWERESGVEAALKMLAAPDELPDVVFCCNDDLAVGVQETLQEHGIRVPDDVMVTGFDNRSIGMQARPRITTVDRDYPTIGQTALQTAIALVEGRTCPQRIESPARYVLSESCRYRSATSSSTSYAEKLHAMDYALKQFFEVFRTFQPEALNADSLEALSSVCEKHFSVIGCHNAYLMVSEDYLDRSAGAADVPYGQVSLLMAHDGDSVQTECDERHVYARFTAQDILPRQIPMDKSLYVVYPLRHGSTSIGTVVTEGVSPLMRNGSLMIVLTLLSSAIESACRR